MTFREKLAQKHPEINIDNEIRYSCPCLHGYEKDWDCLDTDISCNECWCREIPEGGDTDEE